MCWFIIGIVSILGGLAISQFTKMFLMFIDYGGIWQDWKIDLAAEEATKNGDGKWFWEQRHSVEGMPLTQAQEEMDIVYDFIAHKSKKFKLYSCVYCLSIRATSFIAPMSALLGWYLCCPVYLLLLVGLPVMVYTWDGL